MLTVQQPVAYGYKSVHDLPTPPYVSRPSPPLAYQEPSRRQLSTFSRSLSPTTQPMSAPHRGLPPPAAMGLPPQQPPSGPASQTLHSHPHHGPPQTPAPTHAHQQSHSWSGLPAPPQHWQGAEDSMKSWLQTRAEEEKTRQEEEKTRQETLRLEQRKIEMEMLRASLGGGIPPPMIPLVFAGMGTGGTLPQAALDWAQQFFPPSQSHALQLLPAQGPSSPEHHRELSGQSQSHYGGGGPTTIPASGGSYGGHPASPSRPRGQTIAGTMGRPTGVAQTNLPSMSTSGPQFGSGSSSGIPSQSQTGVHGHPVQQDSGNSIYFHHWQPPTSQSGSSSNRPGTPSGETPKKRKATGPHQPAPPPGERRLRSPPSLVASSQADSGRRGHRRQRSDISWYRSPGSGRTDDADRPQEVTSSASSSLPGPSREEIKSEQGRHSVSSMLSEELGEGESRGRQGTDAQYRPHPVITESPAEFSRDDTPVPGAGHQRRPTAESEPGTRRFVMEAKGDDEGRG